jgi:hypothetical protein
MAKGRATMRQRDAERQARSRAAGGRTPQGVTEAEVLLWGSTFMDKEDSQEPRHAPGYDEAAFTAVRESCASCACALCGMIVFGRATRRNVSSATGRLVSESAAAFSTRGFLHNGRVLPLIRDLVDDDDGSFFSCSDCDGELQCLESASGDEPVPLPARFRLDFGLRSDLPEPTVVEKAAIAINRMYGKVVKIKHNMGEFTPPQLCGHLISFRHSGPTAVASSLPNVDFDRLIVVHFIGGRNGKR